MNDSLTLQAIVDQSPALLAELDARQKVVRDFVRGVAHRYSTGVYLFGKPGTAKTRTVRQILDSEIRDIYTYQRGHITPLGLFELLAEHPDEVIVLDDLGVVLRHDVAVQILLAALEAPKTRDGGRDVVYRCRGQEERINFRGGLILISNRALHDDDLLDAFRSRVNCLNYDPTDAQLGALILAIADRGWTSEPDRSPIAAEDARKVAEHLLTELIRLACPFDLRLFCDKALPTFQQWKDGEAESDWRDLVTASIEERLVAVRYASHPPVGREAKMHADREVLREIVATIPTRDERVQAWVKRTGKSERAFYRRLAEIR